MAFSNSTITIQGTLNWLFAYTLGRPFAGIGSTYEPALSSANLIKQTMLSAPFAWPWNRNNTIFATVAGQQDYILALPDFGWLERVALALNGTTLPEFTNTDVLPTETKQGRPNRISVQSDDTVGNITFRLFPVPDQAYNVSLIYQKEATLISGLTSTWAPIPDKFSFIYQRGLLAMLRGTYDLNAYQADLNLFLRQLVGVSQGLSDTQKNIFLLDRIRTEALSPAESGSK